MASAQLSGCDKTPHGTDAWRAYSGHRMVATKTAAIGPKRTYARVAVCVLFCGCASSEAAAAAGRPGDAGPFAVEMSESAQLRVEVRTEPDQPPTRGLSTVTLEITDAMSGEPAVGLELAVVPWMPAMGHGTSVKPAVEAKGDGVYEVSRVNMYMGGEWDLRITISGTVTDRATLHFSIR
jgi:hypothetical protein